MNDSLDDALHDLQSQLRGAPAPVVTIGNFDGVHLGHQAIVRDAVASAAARGTRCVVLSFEPHPVTFFRALPPSTFRLTDAAHKEELLLGLGAARAVALPFGRALAALSPEEFVEGILHRVLGAAEVRVGYDFNFGRGRAGTPEDLRAFGEARGIEVAVHGPVQLQGETISSTSVRRALQSAELDQAAALLGRPHAVRGPVLHGDARGRGLGIPTANITPMAGMMVPHGVYVTVVRALDEGASWPAITNIGVRPTFGSGHDPNVESFILHGLPADADLYGRPIEVELLRYLRDERAFDSIDALKAQIALDLEQARAFHGLDPG